MKASQVIQKKCLDFRQLSSCLCLIMASSLLSPSLFCQERVVVDDAHYEYKDPSAQANSEVTNTIESVYQFQNQKILKNLNPYERRTHNRNPANLIPSDELEPLPPKEKNFVQTFLVDDESGVMESMRRDVRKWQETEEYAKYWNLKSTGLYEIPDDDRQKRNIERQFWRYLDRRVSEEINKAEEGSALHAVGRAEEAVRPESSEVNFSDDYRLRFRVRPLQGQMKLELENPFVEHELLVSASGRADMTVRKNIEPIDVDASVNYRIKEGYAVTRFDKRLTQNIRGQLTHYTPNGDNIEHEARLGFYYSKRF